MSSPDIHFADEPNVLLAQGDILVPPFRDGVIDRSYSIGVFHHTADPAGWLRSLARRVRTGGLIASYVYPIRRWCDTSTGGIAG